MTSNPGVPGQAPDLSEAYRTIADSLAKSEVNFLIGAGMSFDSGIATGSELAKRMLRRAVLGPNQESTASATIDPLAAAYPFEAIAEYLTMRLATNNLAAWLRDRQAGGFDKAKPNDAHVKLHELFGLIGRRFPKMIFTTNFDSLIEDEFKGDALAITTENITDLEQVRKAGKLAVIHLHGCVSHPNSLVFGEESLVTLAGPLFDLLRASLATEVFVLVGYSLSDTNLRRLFFDVQRIARTRQGLRRRQ